MCACVGMGMGVRVRVWVCVGACVGMDVRVCVYTVNLNNIDTKEENSMTGSFHQKEKKTWDAVIAFKIRIITDLDRKK